MVTNLGLRQKAVRFGKRIRNRLPLHSEVTLAQAVGVAVDVEKNRRGITTQQYIETVDKIVDQPWPYLLLKKYSNKHPFLRIVHGAIIREVVRNRWNVKEKFAKRCTVCGREFEDLVEECPDCGPDALLRDPNPQEKKRLEAFLKDPNRDDEMVDIIKSILKDSLAVDDWYVSVSLVAPGQYAIYVEDAAEMFICADKHGRLGNGVWFCQKCWSPNNERVYKEPGQCPMCDATLKETAYVQKKEGNIKARFSREEIIHGNSDPWLPQLYGNSKVMAVLQELRTALAMGSFNFDTYASGHLAKLVLMEGESQNKATEIANAQKEQAEKVEIDRWTGRIGRKVRNMWIGTSGKVAVHDVMPDPEKMQSLDWMEFWFVKIVGAIYSVQPVMMNAPTRGPGGYFQRMQVVVQNDATREYQRGPEDAFNEQLLPLLDIHDWRFEFAEIEPRNEMEESQIWQVKVAAGLAAVQAGLKAELTDEGELKISGEFVKPELPIGATHTLHEVPQAPKPPEPKQNVPFSTDKIEKGQTWLVTEKGQTWLVTEVNSDSGSGKGNSNMLLL